MMQKAGYPVLQRKQHLSSPSAGGPCPIPEALWKGGDCQHECCWTQQRLSLAGNADSISHLTAEIHLGFSYLCSVADSGRCC